MFSQDELAEMQTADPGYAGTNNEIDMESYEYDLYAYWDDLEYADDAYWDSAGQPGSRQTAEKAGQKRKRGAPTKAGADKRRKVSGTQSTVVASLEAGQMENVLFMSREKRIEMAWRQPPVLKEKVAFAFMPDWRERFANEDGVVRTETMPADMQRAALAKDEETPPKKRHADADAMQTGDGEEDWEDEDAENEEGIDLAALDPDMLKAVLKQKLSEAGLEGMDEGDFMATLQQMLAGNDDEAAGDLANSLLGKATAEDGAGGALSGWLSQQGVSLDNAEEEDDASSVATAELPEASSRGGQSTYVSPRGSAISVSAKPAGMAREMALHPGSPTATEKDMPATTRQQQQKKRKGKKVTFDVPPSSEPEPAATGGQDEGNEEEQGPTIQDPPTSEDPLMSETTIAATAAHATRSKAANSTAVRGNRAKAAGTGKSRQIDARPNDQLQQELEDDQASVETAAAESVKQTRKRKAPVEEAEGPGDGADGKKPERAVKEPATKRTRSARAKAGK